MILPFDDWVGKMPPVMAGKKIILTCWKGNKRILGLNESANKFLVWYFYTSDVWKTQRKYTEIDFLVLKQSCCLVPGSGGSSQPRSLSMGVFACSICWCLCTWRWLQCMGGCWAGNSSHLGTSLHRNGTRPNQFRRLALLMTEVRNFSLKVILACVSKVALIHHLINVVQKVENTIQLRHIDNL